MYVCMCVSRETPLLCEGCLLAPEHLHTYLIRWERTPTRNVFLHVFSLLSRCERKHMEQTARALWPPLHQHESRRISPKRGRNLGFVFGIYPDKHAHLLLCATNVKIVPLIQKAVENQRNKGPSLCYHSFRIKKKKHRCVKIILGM